MSKVSTYCLWFVVTFLHTWLFFEESLGFNALLFSLVSVALVTVHHKLLHESKWWYGVGGHLIAAAAVAWHGGDGASVAYYMTLFVLGGLVFSVRSSLPIALFNGFAASVVLSFATSIPIFIDDVRLKISELGPGSGFSRKRAYLYVAPVSVTIVFYLLYAFANPDFLVDLRFPEWELNVQLIFYIMFGFILTSPFFFSWGFKGLVEWDSNKPDSLVRTRHGKRGTALGLINENRQGVIMFSMLNLLIAVFLVFNVLQIFMPSLSHSESSHSEQVHQGFGTLIISIVVAILLIMHYFRSNQNFFRRNKHLILLATVWIVLNGLLAAFTCYKNVLYVDAFGLTYKRIWVFIGIMLTVTGLCLTIHKIRNLKTNWYLIRQNTWVLYFVLSIYTIVDWDRLITWYNPNYAQNLDMEYIQELGITRLPYLKQMMETGDPRVGPYKEDLSSLIYNMPLPASSWKSATLDAIWLKEELGK